MYNNQISVHSLALIFFMNHKEILHDGEFSVFETFQNATQEFQYPLTINDRESTKMRSLKPRKSRFFYGLAIHSCLYNQ